MQVARGRVIRLPRRRARFAGDPVLLTVIIIVIIVHTDIVDPSSVRVPFVCSSIIIIVVAEKRSVSTRVFFATGHGRNDNNNNCSDGRASGTEYNAGTCILFVKIIILLCIAID